VWVFDAFGATRAANVTNSPRPDEPVGYVGQQGAFTDLGTGRVLMGYRYYDPVSARFLTRDPVGYDSGLNLYGYCDGDPVNGADPLGLDDDELDLGPSTSMGNSPMHRGVMRRVGQGLKPFGTALNVAGDLHPWSPAAKLLSGRGNSGERLGVGARIGNGALAAAPLIAGAAVRAIAGASARVVRMLANAANGRKFEAAAIAALRAAKNGHSYTGVALDKRSYDVIPDIVRIDAFTDAKSCVAYVPYSRQMQAMVDAAHSSQRSMNLIVSTTATVSPKLLKAIGARDGQVFRFDPVAGRFLNYP
jgi:RHS repeat-associated protein